MAAKKKPPTVPRVLWQGTYRKNEYRVVHLEYEDGDREAPLLRVEERSTDAMGTPVWMPFDESRENGYLRENVIDFAIVCVHTDLLDALIE